MLHRHHRIGSAANRSEIICPRIKLWHLGRSGKLTQHRLIPLLPTSRLRIQMRRGNLGMASLVLGAKSPSPTRQQSSTVLPPSAWRLRPTTILFGSDWNLRPVGWRRHLYVAVLSGLRGTADATAQPEVQFAIF